MACPDSGRGTERLPSERVLHLPGDHFADLHIGEDGLLGQERSGRLVFQCDPRSEVRCEVIPASLLSCEICQEVQEPCGLICGELLAAEGIFGPPAGFLVFAQQEHVASRRSINLGRLTLGKRCVHLMSGPGVPGRRMTAPPGVGSDLASGCRAGRGPPGSVRCLAEAYVHLEGNVL